MATSGPGATNLVTAIADAKLDSIPADRHHRPGGHPGDRHGRVSGNARLSRSAAASPSTTTWSPTSATCRAIVREAFHIATTGRPGPVLIDCPRTCRWTSCVARLGRPMNLPGYRRWITAWRPPRQISSMAAADRKLPNGR